MSEGCFQEFKVPTKAFGSNEIRLYEELIY